MDEISKRKRIILRAVIRLHEDSGDPIGSHILNDFLRELSVSSATLRNEMAELTSMGLLSQPHTSAGRIPTLRGFRYYVDNLMDLYPLGEDEKRAITNEVFSMDTDPDRAAEASAKTLSKMMGLAAAASTPHGVSARIVHFRLMRVGRYNMAVLGVTDAGALKTRVCRLTEELSDAELQKAEKILADNLCFVSAEDVDAVKLENASSQLGELREKAMPMLEAAATLISGAADVRVYTDGQQNLLRFPEMYDEMRELLGLFSNQERMRREVLETAAPVAVKIGSELGESGLSSVSFISVKYRAAGGQTGGLAIAGPVRMNYAFIIPRLRFFGDSLSQLLKNPA